MAAGIGIGVKIDGGAAGHRCARVGVLVGDDGGGLVALALHELMLEALGIQGDLRIAPLLAHEVRHLDGVLAAVDAVGGNAQIGSYLTDDVADHRRSQDGRIVGVGVIGVVQHDVDQNFGVVGGQDGGKGGDFLVVAVGAALHVQLLGRTGLAADAVARDVGVGAAAGGSAVAHLIFHDLADGLAGALADDLTADVRADLLDDVAVLVGYLIHHMRGDEVAAVDGCRDGGADLQRGHSHCLTEGGRRKLDLAQLALGVILHHARLVGQVHAGALGEAESVEVVVEDAGTQPLTQLDEVDVAAVPEGLGEVLDAVGLLTGAVIRLFCHAVGTGAVEGGVIGGLARVHTHGGRDDLEDASGVVQLGDGLVLPLDVAVGAGVVGVFFRYLLALLIPEIVAIGVFLVDGVDLRLGVHLLIQIGQVLAEIQRSVGVEVRLRGHGKDGTGLDVHDDGCAAVLDRVGVDGLVEVALHDLLHIDVQRQHQIGAVLGGVGGGVGVGDGVAVGIAEGDGAAIDARKGVIVGFFEAVEALAVAVAEAQHRCGERAVGVVALEALGRRDGDAALLDDGAVFQRLGFGVIFIIFADVFLDGELDGVVHLGGQHLIGRAVLGQRIMHGLVLGLIFRRGGIYAVQTLAVAGEQPQGELAAHISQRRLVHGLDCLARLLDGLAGEEGRAVAGVGPDGPYYAGGRQRDAGGIVDLAAGGLDGAVQQLLLGRILAEGRALFYLDVIQAVGDDARSRHYKKYRRAEAEMPQPRTEALVRVAAAEAVVDALMLVVGGLVLHGILLQKPEKRALPHAFLSVCLFCAADGSQNGHGTVVQEIRPLVDSRLPAHQYAVAVEADVGELALVHLHEAQPPGHFFHTGDVGLAVEDTVIVGVLALLAHEFRFGLLDLVVDLHQLGLAPQQAYRKACQQRHRDQLKRVLHGRLERVETAFAALFHPQCDLALSLRRFSATHLRRHIISWLTHS